jgi:drug/metabolite transporter (DMT)-like permease
MTQSSTSSLSPLNILLLVIPPLMWAGNAVVGRWASPFIPPITLNFLRWALAFVLLAPFAWQVLKPSSALWRQWRRFALLGLLGTGGYNTLQYIALQTSTPLNVTLVAASMPLWMLMIGRLFFAVPIAGRAVLGACFSLLGVLMVISHGQWQRLLQVKLVPGDAWMLLAALVWAWYSWLLARPKEEPLIRNNWAAFLLGQMCFGLAWSGLFASGEWWWLGHAASQSAAQATPLAAGAIPLATTIVWSWPLWLALVYVAVGPSLLAYRCWGAGVQRVGPATAGFFSNLTPLFAAVLSTLFLGEAPQGYHLVAFILIVSGILVSSARRQRDV